MNVQAKRWITITLLLVTTALSSTISASSLFGVKANSKITASTIENETTTSEIFALKPFKKESLSQITAARKGHAFIMVLWSIDCPPCLKELEHFQALKSKFTKTNFLLISTDSPNDSAAIEQILADRNLQTLESWIFSDSLPERLRYKIDPNWYGELPRSYFYEADHTRMAYSGMLTQAQLQQWLEKYPSSIPLPIPNPLQN